MAHEPSQSAVSSSDFATFAKCFCINPVYNSPAYGAGHYKKRRGWVLIDLATRAETNFKTMRDAKQHLIGLYLAAAPKIIPAAGV
ncbi:MAG: hypothetical protein EPO02_03275 [Nitrospirae bacterium]|nr:MAG: hypothetical protein EPO02_03275 [Nitrospirota bacterium]